VKPLIKWAGGKSSEIKYITRIIPKFHCYIEPFFGGGALFFHLQPRKAVINDVSTELMMFYAFLKDGRLRIAFKRELENYVRYWERISTYMRKFGNSFLALYERYRHDKITNPQFESKVATLFKDRIVPFNGLFSKAFCLDQVGLLTSIERNLIAKLKRVKHKIDVRNDFSRQMLMDNIETAFRSGFYMHFRDVMNKAKHSEIDLSDAKKVANYYFVREFCYGSMFRFNSAGDFNIPYGGMAYNRKDFRAKVAALFSDRVRRALANAVIENMDFEQLLAKHVPRPNDFVFFDPPYDSEFSEYEEHPFTSQDQERLAACMLGLTCQFILVIKETPFIRSLYDTEAFSKRGVSIESFGKKYTYNIKGRNQREVTHLLIHNLRLKDTQRTLF